MPSLREFRDAVMYGDDIDDCITIRIALLNNANPNGFTDERSVELMIFKSIQMLWSGNQRRLNLFPKKIELLLNFGLNTELLDQNGETLIDNLVKLHAGYTKAFNQDLKLDASPLPKAIALLWSYGAVGPTFNQYASNEDAFTLALGSYSELVVLNTFKNNLHTHSLFDAIISGLNKCNLKTNSFKPV